MLSSGAAREYRSHEGDRGMKRLIALVFLAAPAGALVSACSPTVQIASPDRPIEINLNVRIDQEIRVRLDREVEDLITSNPDIF